MANGLNPVIAAFLAAQEQASRDYGFVQQQQQFQQRHELDKEQLKAQREQFKQAQAQADAHFKAKQEAAKAQHTINKALALTGLGFEASKIGMTPTPQPVPQEQARQAAISGQWEKGFTIPSQIELPIVDPETGQNISIPYISPQQIGEARLAEEKPILSYRGKQALELAIARMQPNFRLLGYAKDSESSTGWKRIDVNQLGQQRITRDIEPPSGYLPTTIQDIQIVPTASGELQPVFLSKTTSKFGGEAPKITGKGEVIGHRPVVSPQVHERLQKLVTLKGSINNLFDMAALLHKGEGFPARVKGFQQRIESLVGINPLARTFLQLRDSIRSDLAKIGGSDVGNLALQEQEWGIKNITNLGATAKELQMIRAEFNRRLDRKIEETNNFIKTGQVSVGGKTETSKKKIKYLDANGNPVYE